MKRAPQAVHGPCRDQVEVLPCHTLEHPVERRALLTAVLPADSVVLEQVYHHPAVALCDGFELTGQTPAIALTAYGRPEDRVRSLSAGYNRHVVKPVDPAKLGVVVSTLAARSLEPQNPRQFLHASVEERWRLRKKR